MWKFFNNSKEKLQKKTIKKNYKKKWYFLIVFLIIMVWIVVYEFIKIDIEKFGKLLENYYYIAFIFSLIFVGLQLKQSIKDSDVRFEYQKKEKAVEIADHFREIVLSSSYIMSVMKHTFVDTKFKESKDSFKSLTEFDKEEMESVFNEKHEIIEKELCNSIKGIPLKIFAESYLAYRCRRVNCDLLNKIVSLSKNDYKPYTKDEIECIKDEILKLKMEEYNNDIEFLDKHLRFEFDSFRVDTLNKIEYISMSFNVGIADDEVVYQSLHQVFLRFIKMMYFHIATLNTNGNKDKHFNNIIELYNSWAQKYHDVKDKEEINNQKVANENKKAKDQKRKTEIIKAEKLQNK
ncbi:MAG: hypothetical protein ACRCSK_03580 [Fusobacteriaceae bacterium]